jgi:hypothetical protein
MYKPLQKSQRMDDYISGLSTLAGEEPINQAGTLSQAEVMTLLTRTPLPFRWYAWLVWLTASRWADVQALSNQKLLFSQAGMVIDFQGVTKSSKKKPFRLDHVVMVPQNTRHLEQFRRWVTLSSLMPKVSTSTATLIMRRFLNRQDVSAHSLKRTALEVLLQQVERGRITHRLVAQMAKHLGCDPLLPDVTVGYIQNKTLLAATNQSAQAVSILDQHFQPGPNQLGDV